MRIYKKELFDGAAIRNLFWSKNHFKALEYNLIEIPIIYIFLCEVQISWKLIPVENDTIITFYIFDAVKLGQIFLVKFNF